MTHTRKPLTRSHQKARQRAGEPNLSLLTEGQKDWQKRVGITDLRSTNATLLEALEQVARLDQWRHSPEWLDNPSCRVDLNAAITNACAAVRAAKSQHFVIEEQMSLSTQREIHLQLLQQRGIVHDLLAGLEGIDDCLDEPDPDYGVVRGIVYAAIESAKLDGLVPPQVRP